MDSANSLTWLAENSAAVSATTSVILTIVTAWYSYLTLKLVRESKNLRLAASRAELAIYLKSHDAEVSFIMLCFENLGPGPAFDANFKLDRELSFKDGTRALSDIGPMKSGISYFAPGRKVEHFLCSAIGNFDELRQAPFCVTASYRDATGASRSRQFVLNFNELDITRIGSHPLHKMADSLTALQEDFRHVSTGFRKLRVLTEPAVDYARRQDAGYLSARIEALPDEKRRRLEELISELSAETATGSPPPTNDQPSNAKRVSKKRQKP